MTDLLNLEVDLLLFGATSACIELDAKDEPVPRDMHGRVATSPERADGKRRGCVGRRPRVSSAASRRYPHRSRLPGGRHLG